MTEPMTAERLAELSNAEADYPIGERGELLAEVKRLKEHLAEYVGWEPTVKEEYDHACAVAERAEAVVRRFEAGDFRGEADPFLAALKHALEMS